MSQRRCYKNEDDIKSSKRNTTRGIVTPKHLRNDAPDPMQHLQNAFSEENKPEKKSSKELVADANCLQGKLAKLQAAKEDLLIKFKTNHMAPQPLPLPVMGISV
ncbi:hypothetical protein ACA910_008123 [Epithemia clementina (nom. ined.)]